MIFLTHGNSNFNTKYVYWNLEKIGNYFGFTNSLMLCTELCCRNQVKLGPRFSRICCI